MEENRRGIPIELPKGVKPWASDESMYDIDDESDAAYLQAYRQMKAEQQVVRDSGGNVVKVPKSAPDAIIGKSEIIKGERSISGLRSYWLLEKGMVKKSVTAFTDEEAELKLQE